MSAPPEATPDDAQRTERTVTLLRRMYRRWLDAHQTGTSPAEVPDAAA